jgi:hypothetical protein
VPRPAKAVRRHRPYPRHLVRFPWALIPQSRRSRRRHSIGYFVWLGSHPVLTLIALMINLYLLCLIVGWIALVACGWALWAAIVTVGWACGGFQGTPHRR